MRLALGALLPNAAHYGIVRAALIFCREMSGLLEAGSASISL
jgi:hypothetical protein